MKRVLIVDDIEENLYLLTSLLEGHGYEVDPARNGSEAIVKALAVQPDMIISDILMPVIDGYTLCRIWKADERLSRAPFIFYTATYTDPRDERLALDMGADSFIIKPTEPDEFIKRIEEVLTLGKSGELAVSQKAKAGEEAILKNYNEVLIRKLEHKMLGLEETNRKLESEIEARIKVESALRENEEIILKSLREKDLLLKEIHHRVKNNMQVISSILGLKSQESGNSELDEILKDVQNRIRSIALIHESLYKSDDFSRINFYDFVEKVMENLLKSFNIEEGKIHFTVTGEDMTLGIDIAVPCGLMVNELLSNALKYAFPGDRKGMIHVELARKGDVYSIAVADDGTGLPGDVDVENPSTLGLRLVSVLIKQIDGKLTIEREHGTAFVLSFMGK